jgi:hypothetical protein
MLATKGDVDVTGDPIIVYDYTLISKHAIVTNSNASSLPRLDPVGDGNNGSQSQVRLISNTGGVSVYTGYLTTFLQQETTLSEADFLRYFALIPQIPANGKSVNGLYVAPDGIKLKVYYTTPGAEE